MRSLPSLIPGDPERSQRAPDFRVEPAGFLYSEDGKKWIPLEERGIRVDDDGYDMSVAFTTVSFAGEIAIPETGTRNIS